MSTLEDTDLPGFWREADRASLLGQKRTLWLNRVRLAGAVSAALGGAFTWVVGSVHVWSWVALIGFASALIAEIALVAVQPQRDWYSGRALAESSKTLAWRYAVGGDPFFPDMDDSAARAVMRTRLAAVAEKGKDRIAVGIVEPDITDKMEQLRRSPFAVRKAAYIDGRTTKQHRWYTNKAAKARKWAFAWAILLMSGEVIGLALAAGRAFDDWQVDVSGILASFVAAGAAWVGLKQYSPLASAYSTAANELALQAGNLRDTSEQDWPAVVADAEEAISREHTMWVASRSAHVQ